MCHIHCNNHCFNHLQGTQGGRGYSIQWSTQDRTNRKEYFSERMVHENGPRGGLCEPSLTKRNCSCALNMVADKNKGEDGWLGLIASCCLRKEPILLSSTCLTTHVSGHLPRVNVRNLAQWVVGDKGEPSSFPFGPRV